MYDTRDMAIGGYERVIMSDITRSEFASGNVITVEGIPDIYIIRCDTPSLV